MPNSILIVDDEEPVRRTFQEWLESGNLGCEIRAAADAESALRLANEHPVDLAILDWNLGAGNNGLQLLEDLYVFHPHIVAIMITGHAQQATPLNAMRMGIRDYLDKNRDLHRDSFLAAVRKQLDHLRPAKRERLVQARLVEFRSTVEKILPLVRTTAAVNDPVPLGDVIRHVLDFVRRLTKAGDGVLLLRSYQAGREPAELVKAHDLTGASLDVALAPFAKSLASAILSMQGPCAFDLAEASGKLGVKLQPFEQNRRQVLGISLPVGGPVTAVLELFDKADGAAFTAEDRSLLEAVAGFAGEALKQSLAERQTDRLLAEALQAALKAGDAMSATMAGSHPATVAPSAVRQEMQNELERSGLAPPEARESLELAELIRSIAVQHGPAALAHCVALLREVERMLRSTSGEEGRA